MRPRAESTRATPVVSVVIPFHDDGATLPRALASVTAQTFPSWEAVVVDDGSALFESERLDRYLASHPHRERLRLIRMVSNRGPGHARNAGWDACTGDLVAFLDADDAWHPAKLERQVRFMQQHSDVAAVGGPARTLLGDRTDRGAAGIGAGSMSERRRRVTKWSLALRNPYHTSSVMVRRSLPWRFAEGYAAEDLYLWGALVLAGSECRRFEEPLSYRHKDAYGAGGLSGHLLRMQRGELRTFRDLGARFSTGPAWPAVAWAVSMVKFVRRQLRVLTTGVRRR